MALFPAIFLFSAVLFFPGTVHAGFFSMLARFFASAPVEVEEHLPSALLSSAQSAAAASALGAENRSPAGAEDTDDVGMNVVQENALVAPLNPVGTIADDTSSAGQIFIHTVRPGDTLASIAKSFDVSVNTILWANNLASPRSLQVGAQIVILPVSGIKHEVKKGETIASIAKKYRGAIDEILQFNGLAPDERLAVGATLIVPNGELYEAAPIAPSVPRIASLPVYTGYYLRPILGGRRSRGIHGYNGVDLASTCGLAVLASADGQVLLARSSGWNGGYGRYAVIAHPNGTQTLYAHLKELTAVPGQNVRQGEAIGAIGSSGNSTGCHVHFEIRGARNPF
ncbi:MAG: M23 family metallopeptidase [bacterium]|nr:M23 family metallopeptidase [bacterium]